MSKSTYVVRVIRKGREKDYFDFWRRQRASNGSGEALDATLVGFEVSQDARSPEDAVLAVRKKHPGHQIDVEATQRLAEDA
jgi:hypothetical protein